MENFSPFFAISFLRLQVLSEDKGKERKSMNTDVLKSLQTYAKVYASIGTIPKSRKEVRDCLKEFKDKPSQIVDIPKLTGKTGGERESFYKILSSTKVALGLIVMVLYKPRTWCAFCPMGTMTQGICKLKNNGK